MKPDIEIKNIIRRVMDIRIVILITIHLVISPGTAKSEALKDPVFEMHEREGLANFLSKASRGDTVNVAYLGGSITRQAGWRKYSFDWLKGRFPGTVFSEINAAIGGTGSDFGVFRLHEQVLRFKPDLVLIEFAVNDSETGSEKITRSVEGIVRQIWENNPGIDICFIYTIMESFVETEQQGNLPTSIETMEEVATHYGIPTINFGKEVCRLVKNGQLIFKGKTKAQDDVRVFSRDGVHPYPETGHVIYQEVLKRSFEKMIRQNRAKIQTHDLPTPLNKQYFSNTRMLDFRRATLTGNWKIIEVKSTPGFAAFGKFLDHVGKAGHGATLSFRFKGKAIGIYDIIGPDAGRIIVSIDGSVKDTVYRFDKYSTYRRMNYFVLDGLEDKEHEVTFKTLTTPFDKKAILARQRNSMKDPLEYAGYNWYAGKILLDGILLDP